VESLTLRPQSIRLSKEQKDNSTFPALDGMLRSQLEIRFALLHIFNSMLKDVYGLFDFTNTNLAWSAG
jgi:hypothetical protein